MMRCRRSLILTSVVATAAFALLAAGCGGGGSPGVASVASSTTATTHDAQSGLVAYSACMRSHGVPSFPDPDGSGGIPKLQVVAAAESNQSTFNAAQTACNHLLPRTAASGRSKQPSSSAPGSRTALSFARCMRSHGVSRFPDPTAQGQLTVEMVQAQGIDVRSPAILRIVQACLPASHGGLTPAKVREALNNAGG